MPERAVTGNTMRVLVQHRDLNCQSRHGSRRLLTRCSGASGASLPSLKWGLSLSTKLIYPRRVAPCAANKNDAPSPANDSSLPKGLPELSLTAEVPLGIGIISALDVPDDKSMTPNSHPNVVRTTGLRRTPLGGGVKNATQRYDLPPPAVAVRNLVERAQFCHLCTVMSTMHHRRAGYPFGTLVDFAIDGAGFPILCLSPLGIHTRNIAEDPRSSIVVQMPGWTGLANARVTIFGDVYKIPQDMQDLARDVFIEKHASDKKEKWVTGNFTYFRMHSITDIYFVGGFGTVTWVDVDEYVSSEPDVIVLDHPSATLQQLNDRYSSALKRILGRGGSPADDAAFISVDKLGADIRVRNGSDYSVERIGFDNPVHSVEDALASMHRMVSKETKNSSKK